VGVRRSVLNEHVRLDAEIIPHNVTILESKSLDFPATLRHGALEGSYPCIWAIGNLDILKTRLVGLFCSTKCPGSVIVPIYDLARALRDSGISVISGFHTPMEKECLDLLLRGRQPVVLCPARNIQQIQLPAAWRTPIAESRMLMLSPFSASHRRPTAGLAEERNLFVSTLVDTVVIVHAHPGSKIARLRAGMVALGKRVYTLNLPENASLIQHGVAGYTVTDLVDCLLGKRIRIDS
jgi:predicted Rossmann fold nucleotide-binding protein DprA/Smf involved in DNA uptake